jgi:hypothetical protein
MAVLLISKVFSQEASELEPLLSPSRDKCAPAPWPAEPMPSEDPRKMNCDHRDRGSATVLDPDAEFGGREARKKIHRPCHLYPQLREFHAAD